MDSSLTPSKTKIFYDGGCKVCDWEIKKYLKLDHQNKLTPVDINLPDFDAKKFGLDSQSVQKHLHVLSPSGELKIGVDAFIEIWNALDQPAARWASKLAKFTPIHLLLRMGYFGFVHVRPYLPRNHSAPTCETGTCQTQFKSKPNTTAKSESP
jgi:predicted DCC family thiol-disulfide oxidoreductase YuxK